MKRVKRAGLLVLCMVLFCGIVHVFAASEKTDDKIKEGISIGGKNVSGMTYEEAFKIVKKVAKEKLSFEITLKIGDQDVKIPLKSLGYKWANNTVVEEALGAGKKGNIIKRYKDVRDIKNNGKPYDVTVDVTQDKLIKKLKKQCKDYNTEAKNASLKFTGDGFDVVKEQDGCEVDYDVTAKKIQESISDDWNGESDITVEASVKTTKPKYTTKDLEQISTTPMGSFSTTFSVGGAYNTRNLNIKNGVEKIDGSTIYPGEEYSCNAHLIPWTEENGWHPAGTYSEGEVIDSLGGGICQVSSTLYNALLNAEITVTERYSHSMAVSYVDLAADAALAGDYKDLKFRNDTDAPIYIQGIYMEGQITFRVYGHDTRPDSHSVKYVSVTKKTIPIKESVKKDDSKPKGYESVESNGHVGYVAELYKVTYENGKEVSRELLHTSTYRMAPKKIIRGTGKDEEATEEETTEKKEETTKEKETKKQEEVTKSTKTKKNKTASE